MKVKLISDLHLEFYPYTIPYSFEDVLVIAGDTSPDSAVAFDMIRKYMSIAASVHVVYVLGNHDYFGKNIEKTVRWWESQDLGSNFHFLHNNSVLINGIRFFGATMWTDMNNLDPTSMEMCQKVFGDHTEINDGFFTPAVAAREHMKSRKALEECLRVTEEPVVVVTHHLPTSESIDSRYIGLLTNAAFAATDMDEIMNNPKIMIWFHGHTHSSLNYKSSNGPRVVCNPRGYVSKYKVENKFFNDMMHITLPLRY